MPLMASTPVFKTLSFRARQSDKDSESNSAVANRMYLVNQVLQLIHGQNPVTTVTLTRIDFAADAAAAVAAAVWDCHQLIPNDVFC